MSGQHLVSGGHRLGAALHSSPALATLWARRITLMAAATLVALPEAAHAQMFWGWGPADYYERPVRPKRAKVKRKADPAEAAARASAKPVGPLVIAVSVERQRLKVYDSNGLFAEAPVSTGTKTHPTPYGVFSIIQKNRHHVSNLYAAQMPYMQRITWSGVAMHTGPLPGYAASHGCIRMPNDFAARLWTWTKMGTRVIVAPGDASPMHFSHPKLVARMVPPPTVSTAPAPAQATTQSAPSTADHAAMAQQRTADAREAIAGMKGTLTDATPPSLAEPPSAEAATADPASLPDHAANADIETAGQAESQASDATDAGDRTNTDDSDRTASTLDAAPAAPSAAGAPASSAKTPEPIQEIAKPADIIAPDAAKPAATAAPTVAPEPAKPALATPARRFSHVAVFISRKDRKLYVRHGYEPVFDTPVEIADADRPLGTHVFTARGDKDDSNLLQWSVVSLPQVARRPEPRPSPRQSSRRPVTVNASVIAPLSAKEALDRIVIPQEALERIAAIISPGGSFLISDHGLNGWETGKGTDFIVPLR